MERRPATIPWKLRTGSVESALVGKAALLPHRDRRPALRRSPAARWWRDSVVPRRADRLWGRPAPKMREASTAGRAPLHQRIEAPEFRQHLPKVYAGLVVAAHRHQRPRGLATTRHPRHRSSRMPLAASHHSPPTAPAPGYLPASRSSLPGIKRWSEPERRQQLRRRGLERHSPEQDRFRYGRATHHSERQASWPEAAHFHPALVESPLSVKP
ncbi:hypothetical protein ANOBCDAF_02101 [Pleomorphomonas sp. T1.2MG-36]|nr:hypothetical protein ANOBCDAF_02101 [Pleomorphomonas sp. T1.2MG-36]